MEWLSGEIMQWTIFTVAVLLMWIYVLKKIHYLWVMRSAQLERSRNTNQQAIDKIKEVVRTARQKVEIFDDGDCISENKQFTVLIIFHREDM